MGGVAAIGRPYMLAGGLPVGFRMPDFCFRAPFGETGAEAPEDLRVRGPRGRVDRRWVGRGRRRRAPHSCLGFRRGSVEFPADVEERRRRALKSTSGAFWSLRA